MTLNELKIDELAIISIVDTDKGSMSFLFPLMRMGVLPGLEITKLSSVQTCSEYQIENISGRVVISKQAGDYIIVVRI